MSPASAAPLLEGITVLDFTRVLAGPYCTRLLADLGARVLKIERPGEGDDTRRGYYPARRRPGRSGHLLRAHQRRQAERVARSLEPPRPRGRARPGPRGRRRGGELRAGGGGAHRLRLRGVLDGQAEHRLLLDLRLRPDRPHARHAGVPPHHQRGVRHHAPRAPDRSRPAHRLPAGRRRAGRHPRLRRHPGRARPSRPHRAGRLPRRLDAGGDDRRRGHHLRRHHQRRRRLSRPAARAWWRTRSRAATSSCRRWARRSSSPVSARR